MNRAIAAALVLAATALLAPALASAQAAPAPGELWSEFPLQPVIETVPTSSGTAPAVEQPVTREDPAVRKDDDDRTAGFLIVVGAALAAGVGFVGRRRVGKRRQSGDEVQSRPEPEAVRTVERPAPAGASRSAAGSVAVASRLQTGATTTLIQTLSPQARLAERHEEMESDTELETHRICEIACWRGYVTWQFYVESASQREASLVSPFFRAPGKGVPEQTDVALHAHAVLVDTLVAAGWEPEGYGEEWFSERFQRPNA
jgi:hypothetical protein